MGAAAFAACRNFVTGRACFGLFCTFNAISSRFFDIGCIGRCGSRSGYGFSRYCFIRLFCRFCIRITTVTVASSTTATAAGFFFCARAFGRFVFSDGFRFTCNDLNRFGNRNECPCARFGNGCCRCFCRIGVFFVSGRFSVFTLTVVSVRIFRTTAPFLTGICVFGFIRFRSGSNRRCRRDRCACLVIAFTTITE